VTLDEYEQLVGPRYETIHISQLKVGDEFIFLEAGYHSARGNDGIVRKATKRETSASESEGFIWFVDRLPNGISEWYWPCCEEHNERCCYVRKVL
jgi:hypothetical protein